MATDNNLDLALRIKADAAQANAALSQVQAQLKGVEQQAVQTNTAAAAAAGKEAEAIKEVAAAQTARAETEDEARERIRAMVQQSVAAADANAKAAASVRAVSGGLHVAADANSAYATSTAKLVAAQDAAMVSFGQFTTVARDADAAMTALKAGSLTSAAYEKAVNDLGKAVDVGAITQAEYVAALKLADKAKIEDIVVTKAQSAANKEAALSSRAWSEIATSISEVLSGNFGRLRRTGAAFANQAGLLTTLMTPMGLGMAAAAVGVGVFVAALIKGEEESNKLSQALILTGDYAGKSSAALQQMAAQMDSLDGITEHAAAGAIAAVVATGKFYGDQVQMVSKAALEMQQATGQSLDTTIKQFESLGADPIAGLMKLNETMHFVTQAVYDQVTALQRQGEIEQAAQIAQRALADAIDKRTAAVRQNVGLLQSAWAGLKDTVKEAWDAMLNIGRSDDGENLQRLQQQLQSNNALIRAAAVNPNAGSASMQAYAQGLIADNQKISAQISQLDGTAAKGSKALSDRLAAQQELAQGGLTAFQKYMEGIAHYVAVYKKATDGASDEAKKNALSALNVQLAKLRKSYESETKVPGAAGVNRAQLSAAVSTAQAAVTQVQNIYANGQKALDATHKAGEISDAAYYAAERAMLDVWETDKVAALEKEKVAAQSHIVTQADRVKADQKVAEIDQQITQVHADASLKRQQVDTDERDSIRKTLAAWEKFKNSLGTPLEIQTGQVLNKLHELDQFFDKGATGGEAGYSDALNRIFGGIDKKAPPGTLMQGSRFAAQRVQIQQYYQQVAQIQQAAYQKEMAAAQGNAQRQLAIQKAYETASLQSAQNKADAEAAIKRQEAQYALSAAEQGFGALAQVYAQAYGEQSKQAKIAFALQKASTLANAILAIQESVANSSKLGFPWNIISIAGAIAQGAAVLSTIRSTNLNVGGFATGGAIRGPGTGTSDSILFRGSNGEYVHSAAAVQHYGLAFMDAVNSQSLPKLPGYATGGPIGRSAPTPSDLGFTTPAMPTVPAARVTVAPVQVVIHNQGDSQAQVKQSTGNNGAQLIEVFLNAAAGSVVNGGKLAKAIDQRYIVKRKGQQYGG